MEVKLDRNDLPVCRKSLSQHNVGGDIIKRYRDEISIKKRSHNSELFILNAFLRTRLAEIPLSQINMSDFATYRDKRLKDVKAGTVNREFSIIKHAFDIALNEWDYPKFENPLARLKKLKVHNARNRRISDEELGLLEKAVIQTRNTYIMPIIYFALETGMRRGEILNMRWCGIDFSNRTVHIPVDEGDPALLDKLKAESNGIMNRLLDAYDDFKREGLNAPRSVSDATEKFCSQSNLIKQFVEDCIDVDDDANLGVGVLYNRYSL